MAKKVDGVVLKRHQKLTRETLVPYLERGLSNAEIARHLGISRQAVSKFIKRHQKDLPIVDIDKQIALKCGEGALKAYQYLTDDKLKQASAKQIADIIDTLYSTALKASGKAPPSTQVYIQAIAPFIKFNKSPEPHPDN